MVLAPSHLRGIWQTHHLPGLSLQSTTALSSLPAIHHESSSEYSAGSTFLSPAQPLGMTVALPAIHRAISHLCFKTLSTLYWHLLCDISDVNFLKQCLPQGASAAFEGSTSFQPQVCSKALLFSEAHRALCRPQYLSTHPNCHPLLRVLLQSLPIGFPVSLSLWWALSFQSQFQCYCSLLSHPTTFLKCRDEALNPWN